MGEFPQHIDNPIRGLCVAGSSATTLYNASTNWTIIELITVYNNHTSGLYITIQITDGTTTSIFTKENIGSGANMNLLDYIRPGLEPLILKPGDTLQVFSNMADKVNCYCSGGEYTS
jgi:hypothetical protein